MAAAAYLVLCDSLTTGAWIVLLAVTTAVAVASAGAEARARNQDDPGPVVIDEAAGGTCSRLPSFPMVR